MRAFVAIDVPDRVVESLVAFQSELSRAGADLRLVERQNLHFTVKFLGEITEAQGTEARSRLRQLSMRKATVEVRGAGAFPGPRRPRVVWAGVAPGDEELVAPIAREVLGVLQGIGEPEERPFQAHITLGRVRSFRDTGGLADLLGRNSARSFGSAELAQLKLKSSRLTPAGPVYADIGVFDLT